MSNSFRFRFPFQNWRSRVTSTKIAYAPARQHGRRCTPRRGGRVFFVSRVSFRAVCERCFLVEIDPPRVESAAPLERKTHLTSDPPADRGRDLGRLRIQPPSARTHARTRARSVALRVCERERGRKGVVRRLASGLRARTSLAFPAAAVVLPAHLDCGIVRSPIDCSLRLAFENRSYCCDLRVTAALRVEESGRRSAV